MISVFDTTFQNPVLLAAGTAGFGVEVADVIALDELGGVVTKAVSPEARNGNPPPRVAEFGGGMINSIGLANPGVEAVRRDRLPALFARLSRARVIVNVVGSTVEDYVHVIERLTDDHRITAFELNVSCPNTSRGGEEFGADLQILEQLTRACRASSSRPLVVKLSPNLTDVVRSAEAAVRGGVDGLTVFNTIAGTLADLDGEAVVPRVGAGRGGVSGPALLAVGVLATQRLVKEFGLPVIGLGGIRTVDDVRQYLSAGATLVGIGTSALADPRLPGRIVHSLARLAPGPETRR